MTNEFQVVYHNIDQTEAISDAVQKRIDKLERYCQFKSVDKKHRATPLHEIEPMVMETDILEADALEEEGMEESLEDINSEAAA